MTVLNSDSGFSSEYLRRILLFYSMSLITRQWSYTVSHFISFQFTMTPLCAVFSDVGTWTTVPCSYESRLLQRVWCKMSVVFGVNYRSRGDSRLQCRCNGELGLGIVPRVVHTSRRRRFFHVQQTLGVACHRPRNCTHGIPTKYSVLCRSIKQYPISERFKRSDLV